MPKSSFIQTNFTAGEQSPRLRARVDIAKYANGVDTLENFIVMAHGGVMKRPGTVFSAETRDSTQVSRLIPFEFNTTQAYVLELGLNYIRFYRDNGQIIVTKTISGATQANPCVITATAHGHLNQDVVAISGIVGMTELNGNEYTITNVTANTYELTGIDSSAYGAYTSGGQGVAPYGIANPFAVAELFDLHYAQSADTMWITHEVHKPQKLTRTGHTSWTIADYTPTADPFTSTNNYPFVVGFYEQRLWFGNTNNAPHKIFTTKSGDYEDMTVGTLADDALTYTIASGKVNAIRWITGVDDLLIGTSGSEFKATGDGSAITPTNISIKRQSSYKSAAVQPIEIDNNVIFLQASAKKLREMTLSAVNVGITYTATDLTILSEHITSPGLIELDYKREPDPIIYGVRSDGQLIGMTYEKAQQVLGWHRHITNGEFESIAVIPTATEDQLWVIVKRTINGVTKRFVEYFHAGDWTEQADVFYVDSGLTYSGAAATVISGLDHLEGEVVQVVVDGAEHPDRTVASGSITLTASATTVHVGLKYTAKLVTLQPEGGNPSGTGQGKLKAWSKLRLRVYNTLGGAVEGKEIAFRSTSMNMDAPPPLFTGDLKVTHLGSSIPNTITITHATPFPMTLLGIMGDLTVNG